MVRARSSIGLWLTLGVGVWGIVGKPKDRTIHSLGSQVLQMPPEHIGDLLKRRNRIFWKNAYSQLCWAIVAKPMDCKIHFLWSQILRMNSEPKGHPLQRRNIPFWKTAYSQWCGVLAMSMLHNPFLGSEVLRLPP